MTENILEISLGRGFKDQLAGLIGEKMVEQYFKALGYHVRPLGGTGQGDYLIGTHGKFVMVEVKTHRGDYSKKGLTRAKEFRQMNIPLLRLNVYTSLTDWSVGGLSVRDVEAVKAKLSEMESSIL